MTNRMGISATNLIKICLMIILSIFLIAFAGQVFDTIGLHFGKEQALLCFCAGLISSYRLHEIMERLEGRMIERWTLHAIRYGFRSGIRKSGIASQELAERIIHPKAQGEFARHYEPEMVEEMRDALAKWETLVLS